MTEISREPKVDVGAVELRLDVMELAKSKIDFFETSREFILYANDLYKFVKLNWIVAEKE